MLSIIKEGSQFGEWTVLKPLPKSGSKIKWLVRCSCGREQIVDSYGLRSGRSTKCRNCSVTIHGKSESKFYISWKSMRKRSRLARYAKLEHSLAWREFKNFEYDMRENWFMGAVLDRIDNNKGYCKENCQWLTRAQHGAKTGRDLREQKERNKHK